MKWFDAEALKVMLDTAEPPTRWSRERKARAWETRHAIPTSRPDPALQNALPTYAENLKRRMQERSGAAWEQARQKAMKARWKL